MSRRAVTIELSGEERHQLESFARQRRTAQGLARRARIVVAAAEGLENKTIGQRLGAELNTVSKWRRRFAERRIEDCMTSLGRGRRVRSVTMRSPRWFA